MQWGLKSSGPLFGATRELGVSPPPFLSSAGRVACLPPPFFHRTTSHYFHPSSPCCLSLWLPGCHANKVPMVTKRSCCISIGSTYLTKERGWPVLPSGKKKKKRTKDKGVSVQGILEDRFVYLWCLQAGPWTKSCYLHSNFLFPNLTEKRLALVQVHCFT